MAKPVTKPFEADECAICLQALGKVDVTATKCGHMFHFSCLRKYNKNTCPNCRVELYEPEIKEPVANNEVDNQAAFNHELDLLRLHAANFRLIHENARFRLERDENQRSTVELKNRINAIDEPFNEVNNPVSFTDHTMNQFKIDRKWFLLNNDVIITLFQESRNNMMLDSMDYGYRENTFLDRNSDTYCYHSYMRTLLDHCLKNLDKFQDITELLECAMKYDAKNSFKGYYPNIYNLTKKYVKEPTYRKLLQLPQIQEQLKDSQTVKKCHEFLKESVLLNIFNKYVPSRCTIM
jgi:hypothetical protein